jgi:hypothetical protein
MGRTCLISGFNNQNGPKMAQIRYSSGFIGRKRAEVRYLHQDIRAANRPKYFTSPKWPKYIRLHEQKRAETSYKSGLMGLQWTKYVMQISFHGPRMGQLAAKNGRNIQQLHLIDTVMNRLLLRMLPANELPNWHISDIIVQYGQKTNLG